jgi:hypothetical protein
VATASSAIVNDSAAITPSGAQLCGIDAPMRQAFIAVRTMPLRGIVGSKDASVAYMPEPLSVVRARVWATTDAPIRFTDPDVKSTALRSHDIDKVRRSECGLPLGSASPVSRVHAEHTVARGASRGCVR